MGTDLRKRCKRYDIPGQAHCLTFSCYRRQALFPGRVAAKWFLENISAARASEPFDLWAYVIMPDHVHLILLPCPASHISRILRFLKKPFTDRILRRVRQNEPEFLGRLACQHKDGRVSHHFWQPGGGYDGNLRSVEDVYEKIRYIHANPVRRGLVVRPEDWEWSSYRAWTDGQQGAIQLDLESLPQAAP